jgi:hypothetical protein
MKKRSLSTFADNDDVEVTYVRARGGIWVQQWMHREPDFQPGPAA